MPKKKLAQKFQDWVDARRRFHLSPAHVQMARELGMNPRKLGKIDNNDQEPWKLPLPQFIEHLYLKRFGRERPEVVVSIEERARQIEAKKAAKRARKLERRAARLGGRPEPRAREDHPRAELPSRGVVERARHSSGPRADVSCSSTQSSSSHDMPFRPGTFLVGPDR